MVHGLAWPVPDFGTLFRPQLDLNVQVPYAGGKAGWHLLVDSTGIKFLGERVISRIFEYLVNELYIRAAILIDVQSLAVLRWQPWHRHGGGQSLVSSRMDATVPQ